MDYNIGLIKIIKEKFNCDLVTAKQIYEGLYSQVQNQLKTEISRRDYFATRAMQSLIMSTADDSTYSINQIVEGAYNYADKMIETSKE
jgi:hypothetical protein